MNKEYYYPLWLRIWHWLNAVLFLALIFTGINLQYSSKASPMINFDIAILVHNIAGVTLTLNYLFFFTLNLISGNFKQYLPKFKGLVIRLIYQFKYYLGGIFHNSEHPFETTKENKFNPLQQIAYLKIMYVIFPILLASGWALLFPESIVTQIFNISGLTLTAIVHTSAGFILSIFMIGHVYLATTGSSVGSNFKSMLTGWHELDPGKLNPQGIKDENENN